MSARRAERMLYTVFREQLDDSYVVFHHVGWRMTGVSILKMAKLTL